jgi:hypothetical protein
LLARQNVEIEPISGFPASREPLQRISEQQRLSFRFVQRGRATTT